jgi:peptidoglycan-N-acetylglucosamine deacetylase
MYMRIIAIVLILLSVAVSQTYAETDVQIMVINLPGAFEGEVLALAGTMNEWNNSSSTSVASNDTLYFEFFDIDITLLDPGWQDTPEGANAAFSYFDPGTWNQRIVGSYGSNDNNFRVALTADIMNEVVIDAAYSLTSPPWLIIDVSQPSVLVNGEVQIPPPDITNVSISVIHLPAELEDQTIALIGSLYPDGSDTLVATVTNNSLSYVVEEVELIDLGPEWDEAPLDANVSFVFADPVSLENLIIGDYDDQDGYFRVRLAAEMDNEVVIDAVYGTGTAPVTIDRSQGISVNENLQLPNRAIDPTRFAWPEGRWKALIMSYDDGPMADTQMVSLFNSNGITGTFNLTSGFLGDDGFVPSGQVNSIYQNHEVANHSENHPYLAQGNITSITNEINNCSQTLSGLVGYDINGMAYPFGGAGSGAYDYRVIDIAKNLGIRYSRTTNDTRSLEIPNDMPDGLMQWDPTINDWDGQLFADQLSNWDEERMALLYMWGHSHFLDNTGWIRMESICSDLGNRNDIWYATNLEAADYLLAIYSLVITDNSVYNPSEDISIWIMTENGLEELGPGETIITKVEEHSGLFPETSALHQNYPNPFNPESVITYTLSSYGNTYLDVYNLLGQKVKTLVDREQQPGSYQVRFDGSDFATGLYIYRLQTEDFIDSRKMLLLK